VDFGLYQVAVTSGWRVFLRYKLQRATALYSLGLLCTCTTVAGVSTIHTDDFIGQLTQYCVGLSVEHGKIKQFSAKVSSRSHSVPTSAEFRAGFLRKMAPRFFVQRQGSVTPECDRIQCVATRRRTVPYGAVRCAIRRLFTPHALPHMHGIFTGKVRRCASSHGAVSWNSTGAVSS